MEACVPLAAGIPPGRGAVIEASLGPGACSEGDLTAPVAGVGRVLDGLLMALYSGLLFCPIRGVTEGSGLMLKPLRQEPVT